MVEDVSEYLDDNGNWMYTASAKSIAYSSDTIMEHAKLAPGDYYYQFGVTDVFGGQQTFAPIAFVVGESGVRVAKSDAVEE